MMRVVQVNATRSGPVAAGAFEHTTIVPDIPPVTHGSAKLLGLTVFIPRVETAATGTHTINVHYGDLSANGRTMTIVSASINAGGQIYINGGELQLASPEDAFGTIPTDISAWPLRLAGVNFSPAAPLHLTYANEQDTPQTAPREFYLTYGI